MDPQPFKDFRLIIPTEEVEEMALPHVVNLREEGLSERIVMEWALVAWSEVNHPDNPWLTYTATPKEVIGRIIHEILIGDRLLAHLDNRQRAMVMLDAYQVCKLAYKYFSRYLEPHDSFLAENEAVVIERWEPKGSMVVRVKVKVGGCG